MTPNAQWIERGVRYADEEEDVADDNDANDEGSEGGAGMPEERERALIEAALIGATQDIELAYPDDRVARIVAASPAETETKEGTARAAGEEALEPLSLSRPLSLAEVDALIDEDAALEATTAPRSTTDALQSLCGFVTSGRGSNGAKRRRGGERCTN